MFTSRAYALSLLTLLVACGDDGGSVKTDAGTGTDVLSIDAMNDCDYTEQSDLTNDTTDTGTPETTGLTFTNRVVICGVLDHTHFDGLIVDVDSFMVDIPTEADVIVRMTAPLASTIESVGIDIYDAQSNTLGISYFYGNHSVMIAHVPAGSFELLPNALATTQATASVPYRIEVLIDEPPTTRCPELTTGGYTENNDGAQNTGNDVYDYPNLTAAFTPAGSDAAEATNIVIAPDFSNRIQGVSADVTATDRYEDTDTFEFATGAGTNELTIHMTWPTTGTNLDWILYEKNTAENPIAFGVVDSTTSPELKMTAVKPNASYWLAVSGRTGTTVPADYNVTLCGDQYTP